MVTQLSYLHKDGGGISFQRISINTMWINVRLKLFKATLHSQFKCACKVSYRKRLLRLLECISCTTDMHIFNQNYFVNNVQTTIDGRVYKLYPLQHYMQNIFGCTAQNTIELSLLLPGPSVFMGLLSQEHFIKYKGVHSTPIRYSIWICSRIFGRDFPRKEIKNCSGDNKCIAWYIIKHIKGYEKSWYATQKLQTVVFIIS